MTGALFAAFMTIVVVGTTVVAIWDAGAAVVRHLQPPMHDEGTTP